MDTKDLKGLMEAYSEVYSPEQLDEISQKTATRAYAASSTGEFEGQDSPRDVKRTDNLRRQIKRKFGDKAAQHADRAAHAMTFGRNSKFVKMPKKPTNEELDIFDVVLEFLQVEGYAETLEEAEWLMANVINEEAIGIILGEDAGIISGLAGLALGAKGATYAAKHSKRLRDYPKNFVKGMVDPRTYVSKKKKEQNEEYVDEAQAARENPEKYEREQAKKSAPVRGERTPMPPRGDKRREDFEKWYAKQMGR
jgi:hypothetical protein